MPRDVSLTIGQNLKARKSVGYKTPRYSKLSRMIAARIRIVREARGMTQDDLGFRAGHASGSVSAIESGTRGRAISVDTVVDFAKALRCDLAWLITGHGPSPFGVSEDSAADERQTALPFAEPPRARASQGSKKPARKGPKPPPPKPPVPPSQASGPQPSIAGGAGAKRGTRSARASKPKN